MGRNLLEFEEQQVTGKTEVNTAAQIKNVQQRIENEPSKIGRNLLDEEQQITGRSGRLAQKVEAARRPFGPLSAVIPRRELPQDASLEEIRAGLQPGTMLRTFGEGVRRTGAGIAQAGLEQLAAPLGFEEAGVISPEVPRAFTEEEIERREKFAQNIATVPTAEALLFTGEAAPFLALPGGPQRTLLQRMVSGAAIGGTVGGTRFLGPGESRLEATGQGAGIGLAVPLAFAGVGAPFAIAAGRGAPADNAFAKTVEAFNKIDTPAPLAAVSDNKAIRNIYGGLKRFPGSAGHISAFEEAVQTSVGNKIDDIARKISPVEGVEAAGRTVKKGIIGNGGFLDRFKAESEDLYHAIDPHIGPRSPVEMKNTLKVLQDMSREIKGAERTTGPGALPAGLSKYQDDLLSDIAETGTMPWEGVQVNRTRIGNNINTSEMLTEAPKSEWKRLYAAISDDMKLATGRTSPEALESFLKANKHYNENTSLIDDFLNGIQKKASDQEIFNIVERGDISRVRALKKTLKPEEWNVVAANVLREMGKARRGEQRFAQDVFSTETFLTNWNKWSRETQKEFFKGSDELLQYADDISSIGRAADALKNLEQTTRQPSQTVRGLGQSAEIGAIGASMLHFIATGEPTYLGLVAGLLGTSNASARLMTNQKFVNWLARAEKIPFKELPQHMTKLSVIYEQSDDADRQALQEYMNQFNSQIQVRNGN